jgi:hypothetical protein
VGLAWGLAAMQGEGGNGKKGEEHLRHVPL